MTDEHAEARALYRDYLARSTALERLRRHASAVTDATSGSGQTPVEPLATMGNNGGPLLCDVCKKPMILEGGAFNGVNADDAWRQNPTPGWTSWISGGMVLRVETNGTLRVFHGYPNRSGCVLRGDDGDGERRREFAARMKTIDVPQKLKLLKAYLAAELPERDNDDVLTDIYKVLFTYDPGSGVNAPT